MKHMRQWLMDVSLIDGWLPVTVFVIAVASAVALLIGAIGGGRNGQGKQDGHVRLIVLPLVVAAISGAAGYTLTWLLSDVFVVFGVGLGPRVMAWVAVGFAAVGYAVAHIALRNGMMRAIAALLVVSAILATAIGIEFQPRNRISRRARRSSTCRRRRSPKGNASRLCRSF